MKLDVNVLRYLSKDDFRVLTAVEMGQKNHEIVPMQLIDSISGLKHGGAYKCMKTLLRHKLLHHDNSKYDGYRLTYMGYDFLAIRTLCSRGLITGVGRQIGVGKESDIYEVTNEEGEVFALKIHRLGRTSFRAVKSKRDYLGKRQSFSWLYLSRLAALKEYAFMKALYEHGFPVPQAIDNNRHVVLMTLLDARPLVQVRQLGNPAQVYLTCMELISRLASKGLIHCDFNEFNLLISPDEELTLIDFPQMVSVTHANAKELFERDVECIIRFFSKKIGYLPELDKSLPYVKPAFEDAASSVEESLDVELAASGFQKDHQKILDDFVHAGGQDEEEAAAGSDHEQASEDDEDDLHDDVTAGSRDLQGLLAQSSPGAEEDEDAAVDKLQAMGLKASRRDGEAAGSSEAGASDDEGTESTSSEGNAETMSQAPSMTPSRAGRLRQQMDVKDVKHIAVRQQQKHLKKQAVSKSSRNSSKAKGKAKAAADFWG